MLFCLLKSCHLLLSPYFCKHNNISLRHLVRIQTSHHDLNPNVNLIGPSFHILSPIIIKCTDKIPATQLSMTGMRERLFYFDKNSPACSSIRLNIQSCLLHVASPIKLVMSNRPYTLNISYCSQIVNTYFAFVFSQSIFNS